MMATAQELAPPSPTALAPMSLRRNMAWTLAGNVTYAGCQWAQLMVLARLVTPDMVGHFSLALAVTAPVILFCNLQLRAVQATDATRRYLFGHYLALRLLTTALALLVIAGLSVAGGFEGPAAVLLPAVAAAKGFESVSDVVYGLLQQREHMGPIARSMAARGLLSVTALGGVVYLTGSVAWGVAAMAAAWGAVLAAYDLPNARRALHAEGAGGGALTPVWDASALRRLARLALPLGLVMMLISLNTNIPRYFVEHALGAARLGVFAAMASLMLAGSTLVQALGQAASPRLAKHFAEGNMRAFKGLLWRLCGLGACAGAGGVLAAVAAGGPLLTLLYGPAYAADTGAFVWLMAAAAVGYVASCLGYAMTAARRFRVQVPLFFAVGAVTAGACAALVPAWGLTGAAWAMGAAALAQGAGALWVTVQAVTDVSRREGKG